jgi:hypothetical protein
MATLIHAYPVPDGRKFSCKLPKGAIAVRAEFGFSQQAVVGGIIDTAGKPLAKPAMKEILMLFIQLDPSAPMQEYSFDIALDDEPVEGSVYRTSVFSRGLNRFIHVFQSL